MATKAFQEFLQSPEKQKAAGLPTFEEYKSLPTVALVQSPLPIEERYEAYCRIVFNAWKARENGGNPGAAFG